MSFLDESATPTIKICGITTPDDAAIIISAGADAIGINYWPKSKRYIAPEAAAPWLGELAGTITRVGLFVNATLEEIEAAVDPCVLDALQLHGEETPQFCEAVTSFGLPLIKAIGVQGNAPVVDPTTFPTKHILLDAYAPGEHGGTGRTFQWDVARQVGTELGEGGFLILAGGLTPENVAEAVAAVEPDAVDVASGVETSPGKKDPALVRAFVAAARG